MRKYSKVSPNVWRSKRFRKLESGDAKLLYLYLLTSPHQTSAGCFRLPDAYCASDLDWSEGRLETARSELVEADLIVHDADTEEYFVRRWFRHNPTTNTKHGKGTERLVREIEGDAIREAVDAEYQEHLNERNPLDDVPESNNTLTGTSYLNGQGRRLPNGSPF